MYKKDTGCFVTAIVITLLFLSFSAGYSQGDNSPDAMVNLAVLPGAIVTGSVPQDSGRGIPTDILWDPATNDYATPSQWHEYGLGFQQTKGGITKENPFYWEVDWPTAKNINYITVTGPYDNQPQPTTGWAVQVDSAGTWIDLPKAHNGWKEDRLTGAGEWVNGGLLLWRGLEPVVTTKLRLIAYANPDSLADGKETFADSLWSFVFTGQKQSAKAPHSTLIQYLDFSTATATNQMDDGINLGLLDEAVVSTKLHAGELQNIRGEPADLLWDPRTGDFNNPNTPWGEFGYPWQYDAGVVTRGDAFYWMVEWPVPKNINYFTWGGSYSNQPQPDTPWAIEYWKDGAWVELTSDIGTDRDAGTPLYDSNGNFYGFNGIGVDSTTNSTWQTEVPIQTTKFRLIIWSPDFSLFSLTMRGRGGHTQNWDETDWIRDYQPIGYKGGEGGEQVLAGADPIPSTFKAFLVQYRDLTTTAVKTNYVVKPDGFTLHQNYPNPFNPQTNIQFDLTENSHVRLAVFNVKGQEVAVLVDANKLKGTYQVSFDGGSLSSGVYFYQLKTKRGVINKKMMLLK